MSSSTPLLPSSSSDFACCLTPQVSVDGRALEHDQPSFIDALGRGVVVEAPQHPVHVRVLRKQLDDLRTLRSTSSGQYFAVTAWRSCASLPLNFVSSASTSFSLPGSSRVEFFDRAASAQGSAALSAAGTFL